MLYFNTLPKVLNTDFNGSHIAMTNLLARINIKPSILANPLIYYQYDIQDGDTAESIAYKYYGTVDSFWLIMFANQYLDPQWSFPLSSAQFANYIEDKYGNQSTAQSTVDHYEIITTTLDTLSGVSTTDTVVVGYDQWFATNQSTNTYKLPDGTPIVITVQPSAVTVYDNEQRLNEAKRSINIINIIYVPELIKEFKKLAKQ
jgi:hypothetical protein